MSNTHPDDRMDHILAERGAHQHQLEQWIASPYNQELAEAMVTAWAELKHSYEAEFGEDAYLPDEMSMGDVEERFNVRGER